MMTVVGFILLLHADVMNCMSCHCHHSSDDDVSKNTIDDDNVLLSF